MAWQKDKEVTAGDGVVARIDTMARGDTTAVDDMIVTEGASSRGCGVEGRGTI